MPADARLARRKNWPARSATRWAGQFSPTFHARSLREAVAAAAYEFITGPLLEQRHRVGQELLPPLDDRLSARRGTYRVIYRIDDKTRVVTVVDIGHRRDIYRT